MRPGPIPNRSEDLSRARDANRSNRPPITNGVLRPVVIPEPDENWHPIARMVWDSLAKSGQADWYQQSDWAFAYSVMEDLSRYKEPQVNSKGEEYFKRSGQMLQTIYSALERLLITEGDRRRLRIELTAPEKDEQPASVAALEDYRRALEVVNE